MGPFLDPFIVKFKKLGFSAPLIQMLMSDVLFCYFIYFYNIFSVNF